MNGDPEQPRSTRAASRSLTRAFAVLLVGAAVALLPPVASALWAIDELHSTDRAGLWIASVTLVLAARFVPPLCRTRPWLARVLLVMTALFACELGTRAAIRFVVGGWPQEKLTKLAAATYPDLAVFRGHPFLQFTGRPNRILRGNRALRATTPFNQDGFHGPDVAREKPGGTCRIVCLGASTTASGYPRRMRAWLEQELSGRAFECVNLAHGFYTSAHSVVNFTLNGLDYRPDYVVVHHGWNDGRARQNAGAFRGDYSHVFQPFEPPEFVDWLPIRASVIYRLARFYATGRDSGQGSLDAALLQPVDPALGEDLDLAAAAFRRNIRTIVDLALLRGVQPVLATIPHSTDPNAAFAAARPQLERMTEELRGLAAEYGERILFVDVAAQLTGRNALFKDLGHLVPDGVQQKAEIIGRAIVQHLRTR